MDSVGELIETIRKLNNENDDPRQKIGILSSLYNTIVEERDSLRRQVDDAKFKAKYSGPRYHDPEDRSWRAWPSDDAAE